VIPNRERGNIDEKRWPSSIRQLNPDRVYLKDDKCLVITWVIMRDFYEAYAVCLENQRPEWIPSHAKRVGNGYLWRRFE
jgi:hypothetical protein